MSRRFSMLPPALLLCLCVALVPACKKKKTEDTDSGGGGAATGTGGGGTPPAATSTDYLLFLHFNAKSIRDSALFSEVKQAVAKADGTAVWEEIENKSAAEIGVKWTDIDTVTACVPETPGKGEPKFILILTANKPFDKSTAFGMKGAKADARGFYKGPGESLIHFPNDKTAVLLNHESLTQPYLNGYAKNPSGWPMTADLARAASGHMLFVTVNVQKAPREVLDDPEAKEFSALLAARAVTVTADLKGKDLTLGVRGSFADPATAARAKDQAQGLIQQATKIVDQFATGREMAEFAALKPAVTEAQRAIKGAKVEVSGSDVTLTGSYRADFDLGRMAAEAMKKIKEETGPKMIATNNLKQIVLGLINYIDTNNGQIPVHGLATKQVPVRNPTDKPLLSWRVAILPYIEQNSLYNQFKFDEPWDGPNNKKLIAQMPKIFAPVGQPGKPGFTHIQMVVGPNAMQPGARYPASILDGTSNTIALVEAANSVEWTKPDDVVLPAKLNPGDLHRKFGGQFPGGFNVAMWDGSVRFVPNTVTERTLGLAINPRDGMPLGPDWDAPPGKK